MIDFNSNKPIGNQIHRKLVLHHILDAVLKTDESVGYVHKTGEDAFLVFNTQIDCDIIKLKHPEWFYVD